MDSRKTGASFDELFGQSVAAGLTNILGESGAEATLKHIGLGPFPSDPLAVESGIEVIFQRVGAPAIKRQILKVLFDKMSERFLDENKDDFAKQVEEVRQKFENPLGRGAED